MNKWEEQEQEEKPDPYLTDSRRASVSIVRDVSDWRAVRGRQAATAGEGRSLSASWFGSFSHGHRRRRAVSFRLCLTQE